MKQFKAWILIMWLFGLISASQAASFSCERAHTTTEEAICNHRILNDADIKMATSYNIVRKLTSMGTRSVMQEDQIKWLQLRDQCQENIKCLTDVYKMRQQKLEVDLNRIYKLGPF